MTLNQVYASPNIYIMDGFLSEAELLYLERVSEQFPFQQSFVDTLDQKSILDVEQRTSTFLSLSKLENATVASIERKAADLFGVSLPSIEPLQLVRYQKGQFFGIHHDLGSLFVDGSVELPPRQPWSRRRLATLFCYINDIKPESIADTNVGEKSGGGGGGGCTFFPACEELRIPPKRGRAVLFCNILETGMPDPRAIHAGEPVTCDTVKLGLNIWCCER